MDAESTTKAVREIVGRQLGLSHHKHELTDDDNLWELGMTSITCLGLMLNIEDDLDVEFADAMLQESTFRSVESIVAAIETVSAGAPAPAHGGGATGS